MSTPYQVSRIATKVYRLTHADGAWLNAELPSGITSDHRLDLARFEFGDTIATCEELPEDHAAAVRHALRNRIYREPAATPGDGGPAFPVTDQQRAHDVAIAAVAGVADSGERDRLYVAARSRAVRGMSLRDAFAISALPQLQYMFKDAVDTTEHDLAEMAYDQADAMLRARES